MSCHNFTGVVVSLYWGSSFDWRAVACPSSTWIYPSHSSSCVLQQHPPAASFVVSFLCVSLSVPFLVLCWLHSINIHLLFSWGRKIVKMETLLLLERRSTDSDSIYYYVFKGLLECRRLPRRIDFHCSLTVSRERACLSRTTLMWPGQIAVCRRRRPLPVGWRWASVWNSHYTQLQSFNILRSQAGSQQQSLESPSFVTYDYMAAFFLDGSHISM